MKDKTFDNIYYAIATIIGVAVYAFCFYLSLAFLTGGKLCQDYTWLMPVTMILIIVPYILPFAYSFFFEVKYMRERKSNRIWMFILCSTIIVAFVFYCSFIDMSLLKGRELSFELFLVLEYIIMPIVFAIRVRRNR